ncbi:MAG TPA: BON domain-containing protein [Tahibacter sp.]|uniref:BON domain-containing protein n=1 Tax=Tahibacter sp. TaxID=2056211 RepID=UPI002B6A45BB|nr:BON domain-containing protein [Tahibacter sp.]HSX62511.1 BON domain-containing protein [Tahibacter sp.]
MNRNGNDRDRPRQPPRTDLRDYAGVQRGTYGRYDEDDWQPRDQRGEDRWGYGDYVAERGLSQQPGGMSSHFDAEAQRGDYRGHYGAERGHGRESGYYGSGVEDGGAGYAPSGAQQHPGRGGFGSGAYGGYAERTSGQPGSGAYGRPRGRPGEDFRGRGPKNYVRSDERLREDISERLTADPQIDASEITVEVHDGHVTLTGSVDRRQTRYRVEDLVDACSGVRDIDNRLGVGPAQTTGTGDATNRTPPKNA